MRSAAARLSPIAPLAEALLAQPEVRPAGLGARDTLRLEAGLCLYGHDIDATTTPVEAGLTWAIQRVRRPGGARAGAYPGAAVIESQLAGAAPRKRVGLVGLERVPVREGTALFDAHGHKLGTVTSGTLAPSVDQPIAMAYLPADHARPQHEVYAEVRGKRLPMRVTTMPLACPLSFLGATTCVKKCSTMISALTAMVSRCPSTSARSFFCALTLSKSGLSRMDFSIS